MTKEKPKRNKIVLMGDMGEWPICPHCGKEIEKIRSTNVGRMLSILSCPHCRKVLGPATLL
jgi:uncharacterized protein with PIN domain